MRRSNSASSVRGIASTGEEVAPRGESSSPFSTTLDTLVSNTNSGSVIIHHGGCVSKNASYGTSHTPFLVRRDDQHLHGRRDGGDARGIPGIRIRVDPEIEPRERFTDARTDRRCVLTDAAREHQRIESPERSRI